MQHPRDYLCDHRILRDVKTRSKLTEVRFPDSERVIYTKNPLAEVICQLRFAPNLRIEAEAFAFQENLRDDYPNVKEVAPLFPAGMAVPMGFPAGRSFEFDDTRGTWKVGLASTFVALSTTRYTRWEEFRARLIRLVDLLHSTYKVSTFNRVGLRYRDLISRSQVGLRDAEWSRLLMPHILGELVSPEFVASTVQASRQLVLNLDIPNSAVRFSHGSVQATDEAGDVEQCYLIDADFYTEIDTERVHAENRLDEYNKESGRLFRWCITEELHRAMGPIRPGNEVDLPGVDPG